MEIPQLSKLRTEAEAIANALGTGLLDVADAVTWADQQIAAGDVPHIALCDVAMASRKHPQDVVAMLRSLPGSVDPEEAIRATMRIALNQLQYGERDPRKIASALFTFAVSDYLPEGELKLHAFCFWDEFDLARDGITNESESAIVARMRRLLEAFVNEDAP